MGNETQDDDDEPSIKCKDGIWGLQDHSNAAAHWFELDGHPFQPLLRSVCGRHASNDLFGNDIRHSDHGKCHDCMGRVISGMTTMGWKWVMSRNVVDEGRVMRHTPYGVTAAPGIYTGVKGNKILVEYAERPKPGTAHGKSPWELVADAVGRDSIMPMHAIPVGPLLSIANEREDTMSTGKLINGVEISIEALKEAVETRQIEKMASIEEADRLMRQVDTFREAAKRKELEIDALNETIEYLQNRSGKPQFVNERLNRMNEGSGINVGQINVHTGPQFAPVIGTNEEPNVGDAGRHVAGSFDLNPQAGRSACATNEFSGEVGDAQQDIPAGDCNCGPGCW